MLTTIPTASSILSPHVLLYALLAEEHWSSGMSLYFLPRKPLKSAELVAGVGAAHKAHARPMPAPLLCSCLFFCVSLFTSLLPGRWLLLLTLSSIPSVVLLPPPCLNQVFAAEAHEHHRPAPTGVRECCCFLTNPPPKNPVQTLLYCACLPWGLTGPA